MGSTDKSVRMQGGGNLNSVDGVFSTRYQCTEFHGISQICLVGVVVLSFSFLQEKREYVRSSVGCFSYSCASKAQNCRTYTSYEPTTVRTVPYWYCTVLCRHGGNSTYRTVLSSALAVRRLTLISFGETALASVEGVVFSEVQK